MKTKTFSVILFIAIVFLFFGCKQSPYDKAVNYIDELSAQVTSATNEAEFDKAYNKIITINSNEVMTSLTDLSQGQKQMIIQKMSDLTFKALAVKAILYVMPKDITPTPKDMSKLVDLCINKKLNVLSQPYTDVKSLVNDYYKINQ